MGLITGIPKEHHPFEYRVGMTPAGVSILTARGHQCYVEAGAGVGSGFSDIEYEQAGARLSYNHDEPFRRADLLLKVQRPTDEEIGWMNEGQTLLSFMMLASTHERYRRALQDKSVAVIAYEMIQDVDGRLPVLYPLSQIGGWMAAQVASQFLQNNQGGKGILIGGIASVPPADVVIIGAGVVGISAAEAFLGRGARVILLDHNLRKLQQAHDRFSGQVTTMVSHDFNLKRVCKFADVLLGAVHVPGQRAPKIITRDMVRSMRPGSLIIDMSIDQGGCVETSRPTNHDDPTFVAEGVTHYCVLNVPGVVGRTATHAFLNAAWPFVTRLADEGLTAALEHDPALKHGLVMHKGSVMKDFGR
jgi:alanine dehydrogenase